MKNLCILQICFKKINLFIVLLTVSKRNLILEKQGWINVPWLLYPDTSAGGFIRAVPICEIAE